MTINNNNMTNYLLCDNDNDCKRDPWNTFT